MSDFVKKSDNYECGWRRKQKRDESLRERGREVEEVRGRPSRRRHQQTHHHNIVRNAPRPNSTQPATSKTRDDRFRCIPLFSQHILLTCPSSAMTSIGHAHVAKSSVAGSGLFASQDVVAGDLIFSLARPAVAALDTKNLGSVCANCFASAADPSVLHGEANIQVTVKACTGCKILKYCSKVSCDWYLTVSFSLKTLKLPCDFCHFLQRSRRRQPLAYQRSNFFPAYH